MKIAPQSAGRLNFIDNMRTFLIILVILTHISMTFGPIDGWYFYDLHGKPAITYLMYYIVAINLAYMLAILFMISGYFTPGSFQKKGFAAFWKDRLIKLLIPFALYVFVIVPALNYFRDYYNSGASGKPVGFLTFYSENVLRLKFFGSGPMWFVFVLLLFSLGYSVLKLLFKREPRKELPLKDFPGTLKIMGLIFLLAVTTFMIRLVYPIDRWFCFLGITYIDISHLPQFLFFFVIGCMAYRHKWLTRIPSRTGKACLVAVLAAILLWPVMMLSGGILQGQLKTFFGGFSLQSFLYALWEAVLSTGALIGITWFFSAKVNSGDGFLSKLSKNSFNIYIIHTPIIVGIGYLFWGLPIPTMLKYVIEIILGILFSFAALWAFTGLSHFIQKKWRSLVSASHPE